MAGLTGKRWPIVGKRLHMEFPYIDAEVRFYLEYKINIQTNFHCKVCIKKVISSILTKNCFFLHYINKYILRF